MEKENNYDKKWKIPRERERGEGTNDALAGETIHGTRVMMHV